MKQLGWALLLGLLVSGCATTRVVHLETDDGERIVVTPREEEGASPSEARLEGEEFEADVIAAWEAPASPPGHHPE
ncbi:hypothetical protein [Corallococcus carmarthensis]|uniref:Uncharacterized protein n=1 Tax=Corallococcus carmarthensis TaxID=2316728 RepID=A0A3A8KDG2_9BACT|nr:hypothetical protein [Corallococcus carmarthensis]NOK19465.1 hypothetical protein [Corallococcus carmarthensis]RKH02375.1 hypothetical protein D7X32_17090 [Corallococcus carmarthensis]